ncbi:MAG: TolC family protein, partial [Muribaculaceae bacterium]|nr:TolC family protein [Muribaculaceae bacterium]
MTCSHAKAIEATGRLAEAEASVAKAGRYPSFSVGYRHAFEEGTHFDGFSVGIGLPLYSRRHSSEASDARSLMAENRMRQMETELATGLRTDYI